MSFYGSSSLILPYGALNMSTIWKSSFWTVQREISPPHCGLIQKSQQSFGFAEQPIFEFLIGQPLCAVKRDSTANTAEMHYKRDNQVCMGSFVSADVPISAAKRGIKSFSDRPRLNKIPQHTSLSMNAGNRYAVLLVLSLGSVCLPAVGFPLTRLVQQKEAVMCREAGLYRHHVGHKT